MKRFLFALINLFFSLNLAGQNVHAQANLNFLRPSYKTAILSNINNGIGVSGELAAGFDHLQIGIMTEGTVAVESFLGLSPDTSFFINNTLSAVFLRANFSSIPAYRLGLVTKLGMGYFDNEVTREIVDADDLTVKYPDKILGLMAGIGFSGPIKKRFHWEFMYQLSYHQRPELKTETLTIEKHNAWQNLFKFGISMNLIFGKTRREADEMISGRGF